MGPFGLKGAADHFFRNDGRTRFVDATEEPRDWRTAPSASASRCAPPTSTATAASTSTWPTTPIPTTSTGTRATATSRRSATWTGAALDGNGAAQAGMGVAVGDVDGDGILDLFVNNFSEDFSTLYRGLGHGIFEDVSRASGVGPGYLPDRWPGARPWPTSTTTATWTWWSRTGTSTPRSTGIPDSSARTDSATCSSRTGARGCGRKAGAVPRRHRQARDRVSSRRP